MNRQLLSSMREQMVPSDAAKAALLDALAKPRRRPALPRYATAIAACAVLAVGVLGYRYIAQPLHSYIKWSMLTENFHTGALIITENDVDSGGGEGDRDQVMTSRELRSAMTGAGFSPAEAEDYLSGGWQMTWAKWWKFIHLSEETGDRSLEALLDFSEGEGLAVNTGLAPEEGVDQSAAVAAYQNLMARFEADYGPDAYPAWYGGAYIDGHGGLIVNIVDAYSREGDDKALCLQIQDWAGSDRVGFGSSRYGLGELRRLQDEAFRAMSELGLAVGCGVNEQTGQVELTLSSVTDEALWRLAELDPADDAILVLAGQVPAVDGGAEEPAVSHAIQPGGVVPADEDGAIAWEPQDPQMPCVDEIIQTEPREENTAAYDPLA